jgi:hypothetical protein
MSSATGVIATAILDRLLHHAVTLNIRDNSYRPKEKFKVGLARSEEAKACAGTLAQASATRARS